MRAVVDTNVLVSAILKDQSLPALAVHIIWQRGVLLKSTATERQLFDVLAATEMVTITERIAACRDPTDDKFLELAVNGHADLIVSGDADLLALNPFRDIPIVTPAVFAQSVAR